MDCEVRSRSSFYLFKGKEGVGIQVRVGGRGVGNKGRAPRRRGTAGGPVAPGRTGPRTAGQRVDVGTAGRHPSLLHI